MWPVVVLWWLTQAGSPSAPLPWAALPAPASADEQVEMTVMVRDLRATAGQLRRQLDIARLGGDQAAALATMFEELGGWLRLAAPSGAPVPATLAWLHHSGGRHIALTLRVEGAARERLGGALPGGWRGRWEGEIWRAEAGAQRWVGRAEPGGWLQIVGEPGLLRPLGGGDGWLPAAWPGLVADFDLLWAVALDSPLGGQLREQRGAGLAGRDLLGAEAVGLGLRSSPCGTHLWRLMVAAEPLAGWREWFADREATAARVDARALSFVSGGLPPGWGERLAAAAGAAASRLLGEGEGSLAALAGRLVGRATWVHFGAPGDLALAAETASPAAAAALAGDLAAWLEAPATAAVAGGPAAARSAAPEGAPPTTFLSDRGLLGPVAGRRGARALVAGNGDALALLASPPEPSLLDGGRLTPAMRAALAAPHAWSAYEVVGSDSAWLSALLAHLEGAAQKGLDPAAGAGTVTLWPQLVGQIRRQLADFYDAAVLLDVSGPHLTLDVLASEL